MGSHYFSVHLCMNTFFRLWNYCNKVRYRLQPPRSIVDAIKELIALPSERFKACLARKDSRTTSMFLWTTMLC